MPLFPCVGLRTPGEQLDVNFGQKPFKFDILNYVHVSGLLLLVLTICDLTVHVFQDEKDRLLQQIEENYTIDNPISGKSNFDTITYDLFMTEIQGINTVESMVLKHLLYHGYTESARQLAQDLGLQNDSQFLQFHNDSVKRKCMILLMSSVGNWIDLMF